MKSESARILEQRGFDLADFAKRWLQARIGALAKSLGAEFCENVHKICGNKLDVVERELLLKVKLDQRDIVLRAVFDNSRQLGLSAVRHLGFSWELSDFIEILPHLGSPCFQGRWRPHNAAHVLRRNACSELAALGHFACDYWREALDGLIVGAGENERLARHRSCGHGDAECVDVLFVENFISPQVVVRDSNTSSRPSQKYGPISSELVCALEPVKRRFEKMKIHLDLEGESEGVLFYRLSAEEGVLCGAGGKLLHDSLGREIAGLFPKLILRDASPLAVYGGAS